MGTSSAVIRAFLLAFLACSIAVTAKPNGKESDFILDNNENAWKHERSQHGLNRPRIVGGNATAIEDTPFQASLQLYWRHICGSAVVSENWLVTAAHCVVMTKDAPSWAKTIKTETSWNLPYSWFGRRHNIAEMQIHPNYGTTVDFDIGVIRIEGKFNFGPKIKPIEIPTTGESYIGSDEVATVSGWGKLKEGAYFHSWYLQSVRIPMVPREKCRDIYQTGTVYKVTERMLCGAGVARGSPCQGDSGGPLTLRSKLIGLVSWGMKCNDDKFPSVFTDVINEDIRAYIKEKTGV